MSTITVKELAAPTGFDLKIAAGETLDLKSQGTVTMPTGAVLQVVTAVKTDRATFGSGTTWLDTGLSVAITPISSSSKILITADITLGSQAGNGYGVGVRCLRGSTVVEEADAESGRMLAHSIACHGSNVNDCSTTHLQLLDSPNTTSATTYKIQGGARDATGWSINQSYTNNDATTWFRSNGVSTIVLMEIAG